MSTAIISDEELLDDNTEEAPDGMHREWLMGYLENGGVPSIIGSFPTEEESLEIITRDSIIPKLCGASSRTFIVPSHVEVEAPDGLGHNTLYYMDGHDVNDSAVVYIYRDELSDVVAEHPEAIEQMDDVEFLLQATCSHEDCSWESGVTDDSDRLLHKLSKHTSETGHGVIPLEVVAETSRDEDDELTAAEVVYSRRYNAEL